MSPQILTQFPPRILSRLKLLAFLGIALVTGSNGLVASPSPARAKILTRQEVTTFLHVGEYGPEGFGEDVGPTCGKQRPKFRTVSYSGDFVWQRFHGFGWTTTAFTVSGAKRYDASTGAIVSEAMVQPCGTIGQGSTVAVGGASGEPVTLPYAQTWGMFKLSNYSTLTGGVRQGDGVLHEDYNPSAPSTEWTRDNVTITYSDPDTMEDAIKRGSITRSGGSTSGYSQGAVARCFYQIQFQAGCGKYIFHFTKKKTPCGGGEPVFFEESIVADITTGGLSPEFELPLEDGYTWEILPAVWAEPAEGGCEPCNGSEPGVGSGPQAGSVDWVVPLGEATDGKSYGIFLLRSERVTPLLASPEALVFHPGEGETEVVTATGTSRRQARTPATLADVSAMSGGYRLGFYRTSQVGAKDLAGFYTVTGSPYLVWQVSYAEASGIKTLTFDREYQGLSLSHTFSEESTGTGHILTTALAGGLRTVVKMTRIDAEDSQREIVRTTVKDAEGEVATETEEVFRVYSWGRLRLSEARDPDGANLVTTWSYNEDEEDPNRGTLESVTTPDGLTKSFNYDYYGRATTETRDSSGSRVSASISAYTSYYQDRIFVEGTLTPIRSYRRYRVIYAEPLVLEGVTYRQEEVQEPLYYGEDYIFDSSLYLDPDGLDDPSNLVTLERYLAEGPFKNRIAWRLENDEQLTLWSYSVDPSTGVETTLTLRGVPNAEKTGVTHGIRQETRLDPAGTRIFSQSSDIVSGHVTELEEVLEKDAAGRPTLISYLDGTTEARTYSPCCGLLETTTRNGHTITYGYDLLGRKIREEENGIVTHFDLDAEGRVRRQRREGTDATEIVTRSWDYDKAGRLVAEKDALDRTTGYQTEYLEGGLRRETTTNPDGATVSEVFNADGTLDERHGAGAASNPSWTYALEETPEGFVTAITEYTTETEWVKTLQDMQGRRLKVVYPDAAEETWSYDVSGRTLSHVDADGVTTLWRYERGDLGGGVNGERTTQAVDLGAGGAAGSGEIELSGTDRIVRTTETFATRIEGAQSLPVRRVKTEIWLNNGADSPRETSVAETSLDGLAAWQSANGLTTRNTVVYDGLAATRTETTTYPDNTSFSRVHLHGRLQSETRRDSAAQTVGSLAYGYDTHGRPGTTTDALGGVTTTVYYDDDQVQAVTTPDPDTSRSGAGYDPQTTHYTYDNTGRVWKVEQPDGSVTETTYWGNGKVKRVSGGKVYPQAYTYDDAGRLLTMTTWQDYAGETGEAVTTWAYHWERGWLDYKMDNDWWAPSYTYTPAGRLKTRTWARPVDELYEEYPVTTYRYNHAGDLIGIDYSDELTPDVAHTYDRAGRLLTTTDAAGTLTRSYDSASLRLSREVYTGSGHLSGRDLSRTYDNLQRPLSLATDGGHGVSYAYDPAGRLATVGQEFHLATYGYKANVGTVESVAIKRLNVERVRHTRVTDALGRTTQVKTASGATTYVQRDYTYNAANQRTTVAHEDTRQWAYGYDALGQVTSAEKRLADNTTPLPGYSFGYAFDDIGNRTGTTTNGRAATYTPDLLNRYEARQVPGAFDLRGEAHADAAVTVDGLSTTRTNRDFYREIAASNTASAVNAALAITATLGGDTVTEDRPAFLPQTPEAFVHDEDGNLTQDGRWDYTWDMENRLLAMETRASIAAAFPELKQRLEFAYDAQGRRIRKLVKTWDTIADAWTTTQDLRFLYDGWNLLVELDALNGDALLRSHVWGLDLSGSLQGAGGVGGLLWTNTPTHTFAASADANGNIAAWINTATLAVSGRADYGPFGERVQATGVASTLPFGFSTKYTDAETGLLYYGFRYYNPGTGRWLSRDPIEESGGLNLYGMVRNDAVNRTDYLGLYCKTTIFFGHTGEGANVAADEFVRYARETIVNGLNGASDQSACDAYGFVGCFPDLVNSVFPSQYQLIAPGSLDDYLEPHRKEPDGSPKQYLYPDTIERAYWDALGRAVAKAKDACASCKCTKGHEGLDGTGDGSYTIAIRCSPDARRALGDKLCGSGGVKLRSISCSRLKDMSMPASRDFLNQLVR